MELITFGEVRYANDGNRSKGGTEEESDDDQEDDNDDADADDVVESVENDDDHDNTLIDTSTGTLLETMNHKQTK